MTLPRFTGGKVGKLTFDHLNEAFDNIDGIERDAGEVPSSASRRGRAIIARITNSNGTQFSWFELVRDSSGYVIATDGLNSIDNGNLYGFPILAFGALAPAVGNDVVIVPQYDNQGNLYYVPIAASGGGTTFVGVTQGIPTTLVTDLKWSYSVREVAWNGNGYSSVTGGLQVTAYNGCENPTDDQSNVGVGQPRGPTATMTRQPIKSGTVVLVARDALGLYSFSIPNGYAFTCQP